MRQMSRKTTHPSALRVRYLVNARSLESSHRDPQKREGDKAKMETVFVEGNEHLLKTGYKPSKLLKPYFPNFGS